MARCVVNELIGPDVRNWRVLILIYLYYYCCNYGRTLGGIVLLSRVLVYYLVLYV